MEEMQDKDIVLITRYFDLELSEQEMEAFDQKLREDTEFAAKVGTYKNSTDLVRKNYPNTDLEKRTERWKQLIVHNQKPSRKKASWKWIAGISASILILISSWYFIFPMQENDLNNLTQQAWNKKVGFSNYQVRNTTETHPKQVVTDAFKSYEKKEYQSALKTLENYAPTSLYYEEALLIRALSIYRTGNSQEALQILNSLENFPTRKLSKEARWYKGLIYLDLKDLASAKNYLEIPTDNSAIKLKQSAD